MYSTIGRPQHGYKCKLRHPSAASCDKINRLLILRRSSIEHKTKSNNFQTRSQNCEKELLVSSCLSVCPSVFPSAQNNPTPTGRILMKFGIWAFFENLSSKCKFHYNPTIITDTLHEDVFNICDISLNSSYNEKCFRQTLQRKSKHTFYVP